VVPKEDLLGDGLFLWNRKLCVLVPSEDLLVDGLHLGNRKLCVVVLKEDLLVDGLYHWNREPCVVVPKALETGSRVLLCLRRIGLVMVYTVPWEQGAVCCGA